jgi:hypothetical protein
MFSKLIWKNHGLPRRIISDRDPRFIANFWTSLCKSLNTDLNMSSSHHPQTDGQTEQKNDWVIAALRHFVSFYQNDWDEYLHVVEFGINDTVNSSTGYTPFQLDMGRHPTSILDISLKTSDSLLLRDIQHLYRVTKERIRDAQVKYAEQANRSRLESPFKIGDLVLLSRKDFTPPNLRGPPTDKLNAQYSGPYKIIGEIGAGPSYKLDLPENWAVHNSFHPEKLKKYYWDSSSPHPLSSLPIGQRAIEKVVAVRVLEVKRNQQVIRKVPQALIKWTNHHPVYNCWLDLDETLRDRIKHDLPIDLSAAPTAHEGG